MSFLKFLKREKRDTLDELDLPPAPPSLEDAEPYFGASGFGKRLPEPPEFPKFDEKISAPREMPKFDFPEEEKMQDMGQDEMPDFPSFPEMEEAKTYAPPVRAVATQPAPSIPQMQEHEESPQEESKQSSFYPKMSGRLFAHDVRSPRQRPNVKTVYVRIDNFKATLGSINIVRSDLRKSEDVLKKLENIKGAKDRSFDKVRASLDDLQKKLIFIDKTLFKGE